MSILLETKQLNKTYVVGKQNEVNVLKDVDLKIMRGEFVSVMGPSGSGKSTLLYNICGMDKMSDGSVLFNEKELSRLSEKELSALRLNEMGFIFQQIHLLKNLSILDNIILSGYLAHNRRRGAVKKKDVEKRAVKLMEKTGIAELATNDISQASGGQLQRVGICRALINEPDIIFGDEPTGALNSKSSDEIMELLAGVNRGGTTVMLVTHDVKVAAKTERVLFMLDGRLVAEKHMGKYSGNGDLKAREERLSSWLLELGF
ncbi:MAG: ABC transporter ATP-binding protein [Spirochaetia bacterium]|nr:ABC transporter ATP-binding protein [Spirochaetia bacterium]